MYDIEKTAADFPEKLEKAASDKNLSFYRIAKETGLSQSVLSRYRSGERFPKVEELIRLANFFNVDINYFLHSS